MATHVPHDKFNLSFSCYWPCFREDVLSERFKRRVNSSALWNITCGATTWLQKDQAFYPLISPFTYSLTVPCLFLLHLFPCATPSSFLLFCKRKKILHAFMIHILFNFRYIILHSKICLLHSSFFFLLFPLTLGLYILLS